MEGLLLSYFPLFDGLPEARLRSFMEEASVYRRRYVSGQTIFLQGAMCESLYLLVEGRARAVMQHGDGRQVAVEHLEGPQVVAPAALFASENVIPVTIEAVTDCVMAFVNKNSFYDLMHREPLVMEHYVRILSDKSLFLSRRINGFALQTVRGRLASYLLGHEPGETQQQIADFLGVARQSLARALAEFVDNGWVKMEGRKIVVLSAERLREVVDCRE